MLKGKHISVISSNTLLSLGLKNILADLFLPDAISLFPNFEEYYLNEKEFQPDFIFLNSTLYVAHNEYFQGLKSKLIILKENETNSFSAQSVLASMEITASQSEIVEQLEKIFLSRINHAIAENQEELSSREKEVLKLVAIGRLNKQIADKLNISSHTVISHRKNITRKLSIKTVSGLTVYALLNGLISASEIE